MNSRDTELQKPGVWTPEQRDEILGGIEKLLPQIPGVKRRWMLISQDGPETGINLGGQICCEKCAILLMTEALMCLTGGHFIDNGKKGDQQPPSTEPPPTISE